MSREPASPRCLDADLCKLRLLEDDLRTKIPTASIAEHYVDCLPDKIRGHIRQK